MLLEFLLMTPLAIALAGGAVYFWRESNNLEKSFNDTSGQSAFESESSLKNKPYRCPVNHQGQQLHKVCPFYE